MPWMWTMALHAKFACGSDCRREGFRKVMQTVDRDRWIWRSVVWGRLIASTTMGTFDRVVAMFDVVRFDWLCRAATLSPDRRGAR